MGRLSKGSGTIIVIATIGTVLIVGRLDAGYCTIAIVAGTDNGTAVAIVGAMDIATASSDAVVVVHGCRGASAMRTRTHVVVGIAAVRPRHSSR